VTIAADLGFLVNLGKKVDESNRLLKRLTDKPIYKPVGGTLVVPAGGSAPQLIRLNQRPSIGRTWNILKVGLYGSDAHTAVANVTVDVFSGYINVQQFNPSLQDCILSAQTVPSVYQFSTDVEFAASGEEVYGIAYGTGVTPGLTLQMVVRVAEYNVATVEASTVP
jgi:hypothetical protein